MKREKQIYFQDSFNLEIVKSNISKVCPILQRIVDEFDKIGVKILEIREINALIDQSDRNRRLISIDLDDLVFTRIYPETPFGLDRISFRKLAVLPDLTGVKEAFEALGQYQQGPFWTDVIYWNAYKLTDCKVVVDPVEFEKIIFPFIGVAESAAELDRLEAVRALCDTLDKVFSMAGPDQQPESLTISNLVVWNEAEKKFSPSRLFVKTGSTTEGALLIGRGKVESLKSSIPPEKVNYSPGDSDQELATRIAENRNLAN